MFRFIPAFLIALVSTSTALAQSHMPTEDEPQPGGGGYYAYAENWEGGANSLPYGNHSPEQVRQQVGSVVPAQQGMNLMSQRGYVRRADLDVAIIKSGYSMVVLGYEKPGSPVSGLGARQPVLCVVTKAYEVPGVGFMPSTQVYGYVVADSSQQPVPSTASEDVANAFVLVGMLPSGQDPIINAIREANGFGPGTELGPDDIFLKRGVTLWDTPGGPGMVCSWSPAYNPQVAAIHQNAMHQGLAQGAIWGAGSWAVSLKTSPPFSMYSGAIGFATGFVSAYVGTWMNTPQSQWPR